MTEKIFSNMKPGSLIISSKPTLSSMRPIKSVRCQVTWVNTDKLYYIYKK
jgi:hypothetical protein